MSPHYRYTAKDRDGCTCRGSCQASGQKEVLEQLDARSLTVIDLHEQGGLNLLHHSTWVRFLQQLGHRKTGSYDLMVFCRQFSTMLTAGVTILRALHILSGQMKKADFQKSLRDAAISLETGSRLAEAFRRQSAYFPAILVHMVDAGETGGVLDTVMERMADHFEKQHDLEEKIRSATIYPAFVTATAFIVMAVMVLFVLPQFAQIFNSVGMEMPLFTSLLLSAGAWSISFWPLLLVILVLTAAAAAWYAQTANGRFRVDQLRLCLPLFGSIYRKTLAARFARTLSILLASGVTLNTALELVERVLDNKALSPFLLELREAVNRGEAISRTLRAGTFLPPLLTEMVRVGEETGALDRTLNSTAIFYEREVTYAVERLSSTLEPFLLLVVGLFIGMLVFSILSPMYQVFQMI
ncbi:MAG TPA: type II secretion system F family protein [Candidatus Limnocylindrales bacterium]|nr:type II secretion system F family protein [Candidatus Limnocylindrales bacterium]